MFAFLLLLAWDLYKIRDDLAAGQRSLDGLTLEAASSTGLTELAGDASGHLQDAEHRSRSSLPLRALSIVPVLDDQIGGLRQLTGVTAELGRVGARAAKNIDLELEGAGQPAGRVALLDVALEELDRLEATLRDIDLGSGDELLGPLEGAHDDLAGTIERARTKLEEGRALIEPVRDMLAGPSTFMLLASNNAEMASGSGLTLSAGILTFDQGEIELGEVIPASDLRLPDAVPLPGDLGPIYSPTGVGIDFRSATRTPNLPAMGPVIAEMLREVGIDELDGVLIVDAVALADVMTLTGGVEVGGKTIGADNVLSEVLNENYKQFQTIDERPERTSYQGDIAKAVFESLTSQDIPAAELAQVLLETSEGRHLMMWSADPDLQSVWTELGIAGETDPQGLLVAFQNYSANKLDWYLRPEASLDVGLLPSGDYRARLVARMDVPPLNELTDASPYILGPTPELQGTFLTVHLPAAAYDITTPDPPGFRTKGVDGPMQVRSFLVDVPAGTTFERTVEFSLPREQQVMVLLPSARIEPMPLTVDGVATVTDEVPVVFTWLAAAPPRTSDDAAPWAVRLFVLAGMGLCVLAAAGTAVGNLRHSRGQATDVGLWRSTAGVAGVSLAAFALAGLLALVLAAPRV